MNAIPSPGPFLPKSRITQGAVDPLFTAKVLGKYDVTYYRCRDTGFIQTEEPYWLKEAYPTSIADLDVGYVQRNLYMASIAEIVINSCFDPTRRFVDYGGGCGLFVRLMRDKGFDFFRMDPYSHNIFAPYFEFNPAGGSTGSLELLTAFEVFEHLPDPVREVGDMFRLADSILFSTELQPPGPFHSPEDWWYFSPDHGQHVSFYTQSALRYLADKYGATLLSNGATLHMLTRRKDVPNPFNAIPSYPALPNSLISRDHAMILAHLQSSALTARK